MINIKQYDVRIDNAHFCQTTVFQLEREMHMSISESYFDVTLFASVIRSYMFAHLIDDFWDSECFSSQSMLLRSVGVYRRSTHETKPRAHDY
jgi:hypothetical protein